LFSLFAVTMSYGLRAFGFSPPHSGAIVAGAVAACWTVLLYLILSFIHTSRWLAVLFTAIGISSAAALFWLTVPETYAAGSATILLAVLVAAVAERRPIRDRWFVVTSASTLAVTVTNWTAGILTTCWLRSWRDALQITTNAFALVVALWVVQRAIIPRGDFFIGYSNEQRYLLREEAGTIGQKIRVLALHSMVMPRIATIVKPQRGPVMSVQGATPGGPTVVGRVALASWVGLLLAGVRGWLQAARTSSTARVLGATIAVQIVLHLLYGTETFLYTLNIAPLLVILTSYSLGTRIRSTAVMLAIILVVCTGINNLEQWKQARRFFVTATDASRTPN
jgi:hypothetical protein